MTKKILLTTTSFQDTPGPHHERLSSTGFEILRQRGPLNEKQMLELVGDFDAFLCGDDAITRKVIEAAAPKLKVISKYGIGIDKIDTNACAEHGIILTNCPGVNHTTVAEHVFLLMLMTLRRVFEQCVAVRNGEWKRITGHEVFGKRLGVIGLGRIGQEVIKRANAFGMQVIGYGANFWPETFATEQNVMRARTLDQLIECSDIISLNTALTEESRNMISAAQIAKMKHGVVIVNCARGEIVNTADLLDALKSGKVGGYAADVLDEEPPRPDHPLLNAPNCLISPHIGSRTFESVERQALMSVENLVRALDGKEPLARVQ